MQLVLSLPVPLPQVSFSVSKQPSFGATPLSFSSSFLPSPGRCYQPYPVQVGPSLPADLREVSSKRRSFASDHIGPLLFPASLWMHPLWQQVCHQRHCPRTLL